MSLLEISHLTTKFETQQRTVSAVRDVSYHLEEGEVLGIVGESGSGKSVGMLTLMGLLASNGRVEEGEILFDGENISPPHTKDRKEKRAYEKKMQQIRGNRIGMIFQDPMTFLNPILKIGIQMTEGIRKHQNCSKKEAEAKAIRALCYFYLVRSFKKLPLVTQATIDDDETFQVAASSADEVLDQIVEDLEWAKNYIWDRKFFDTSAERKGRFNKQSVKALLADIYLWRGVVHNIARRLWTRRWRTIKRCRKRLRKGIIRLWHQMVILPCTVVIPSWMIRILLIMRI